MKSRPSHSVQETPEFHVLSEDQILEIHYATLEVLERTGVVVRHEEALDLLRDAGCRISGENRVRIPSWLVEESVRTVPPRVVLSNRNGTRCMFLEGRNVYFGLGSDTPYFYDPYSGEMRKTLKKDVAKAALVADFLPNIDFVMSLGLISDVPTEINDLIQFQQMVENTTKPIVFTAHHRRNLATIIEIAEEVAGGKENLRQNPFVVCYSEPISPLSHAEEALGKLLLCAEQEIPLLYTPGTMSAGTGPATRAGAIVTSNAESLSGIVIHQLKKKGAPIISGGNSMLVDLLTAICSYGAPEFHLTIAAYTDLYHYYGIPVWGFAGCSDAHMADQQAAIEACFSILINALAGTNLIHDVGYLSSGLTGSLEMMAMSDEIIAMARRLLRGVCTDENSLAVEAIDRVGPGGNYLSDDHTLNCFKSEFWRPTILNRLDLEQWKAAGRKTMGEKLRQRVIEIIETHKPHGLSDIVRKRTETIVAKAKTQKSVSS